MSAPQAVSVWSAVRASEYEPRIIAGPTGVCEDGSLATAASGAGAAAVSIQPIAPLDGVVAVAFVVTESPGLVALNGMLVARGLQLLRHADRLDIAGQPFWISAESAPSRTRYDPTRHGPEVRCRLTKARLREGQEIVICPGVPGAPCGVIYKAQAWDAVIEANQQMKCTNCGYRPSASHWRPPVRKPRREIFDGLLQLASRR